MNESYFPRIFQYYNAMQESMEWYKSHVTRCELFAMFEKVYSKCLKSNKDSSFQNNSFGMLCVDPGSSSRSFGLNQFVKTIAQILKKKKRKKRKLGCSSQ